MTEKELELLGFEKIVIPKEESNNGYDFYFYNYKIANGLEFVSCCDDELINNEWYAFLDTTPRISYNDFGELQGIITLLEKAKI